MQPCTEKRRGIREKQPEDEVMYGQECCWSLRPAHAHIGNKDTFSVEPFAQEAKKTLRRKM